MCVYFFGGISYIYLRGRDLDLSCFVSLRKTLFLPFFSEDTSLPLISLLPSPSSPPPSPCPQFTKKVVVINVMERMCFSFQPTFPPELMGLTVFGMCGPCMPVLGVPFHAVGKGLSDSIHILYPSHLCRSMGCVKCETAESLNYGLSSVG